MMRASPIGFGAAGLLLVAAAAPYACGGTLGGVSTLGDGGGRGSSDDGSAGPDGSVGSEGSDRAGGDDSGDVADASPPPMMDAAPTTRPCGAASGPISSSD